MFKTLRLHERVFRHASLADAYGYTRVQRAVDFQKVGDAKALKVKDWASGLDASAGLYPGSKSMDHCEKNIANDGKDKIDLYGHGTHVASIAAGRGAYQTPDTSGTAPGAQLIDVRVLDGDGFGQVSDVLAGFDWVLYHAKEYNIRVINLSLAADANESWLTDPLARAARSAVAAGITVVVAAGNFGQSEKGGERYGTVGSPGNEPSVITVGSANTKDTAVRSDDGVNLFSSRGPTRGSYVHAAGVRRIDNFLKPDLLAPGNKVAGAMAGDKDGKTFNLLASDNPGLRRGNSGRSGSSTKENATQMVLVLSGTSVSAPAVSGAVAMLLQANPGLTPPLIKALLQYTAQPIAAANVLQQGAGLLNVEGAVRLAPSLAQRHQGWR